MRIDAPGPDKLSNEPSSESKREDLERMSREFEAMLMSEILKNLSDTVSGEDEKDAFGGALSGVLWLEMTRALTSERGLGLADAIYRQLARDEANGIDASLPDAISPAGLSSTGASTLASPGGPPPAPSATPNDPAFPVLGQVSSRFGMRADPYEQTDRFHGGLDVAASEGSPVHVTEAGKVIFAGERGDYGNVVVVEHPRGVRTLYAHLSQIDVEAGAELRRGERLGAVGSTGRATGPHLHFEVSEEGTKIDPEAWLSAKS